MNKSMWIPTEGDQTPVRPHKWDIYSEEVLFWVENVEHPYWGHYNYETHKWSTEYHYFLEFADNKVKYFAYISNSYK